MSLIPIIQCIHDEFVVFVSMVDTNSTMDELCDSLVGVALEYNRIPGKLMRVKKTGADTVYPRDMTVAEAGILPMTSLQFLYEDEMTTTIKEDVK